MQQSTHPSWSIRWQPDVLPRWVKLGRATLLCLVAAVVLQSAVNVFWDLPAWLLHVVLFAAALPAAMLWQSRFNDQESDRWPQALNLTPEGIFAEDGAGSCIKMRVRSVSRHWGALAAQLEAWSGQRASVVIWQSKLDPVLYRKISVLLHWHWRGAA